MTTSLPVRPMTLVPASSSPVGATTRSLVVAPSLYILVARSPTSRTSGKSGNVFHAVGTPLFFAWSSIA